MTLLDADKRAKLADLKRQLRALESPKREAAKIARAKQRKATAAARKAAPMKEQRRPRVRNNPYLAFLRRQGCIFPGCTATRCDPAHVRHAPPGSGWRYVGKGEKPDDFRAVPLCREHHDLQHSMSEARFWAEHLQRDPVETCAAFNAAFLAQTSRKAATQPDTSREATKREAQGRPNSNPESNPQ